MTPSRRAERRSQGILQHGGSCAAGILVPLPAGEPTCGARGTGGSWEDGRPRDLRARDLQGFLLRPLAPSALPCGRREAWGWVVESAEAGAGGPKRGLRAKAERAGQGRRCAGLGRERIGVPRLLVRPHVHQGVKGGLGTRWRKSEKAKKRDNHESRLYARAPVESISCIASPVHPC